MNLLRLFLPKLGINAVPILGLTLGGWSAATALTLYWCENLTSALLIAVRIRLHQHLTRKRGHFRSQLNFTITNEKAGTSQTRKIESFFLEYLIASVLFTLAHGVFLSFFVGGVLGVSDGAAVRQGVMGMAVFLLIGFAFDLIGLKDRPFIWVKRMAELSMGRVVLVHLAIILGMFFAAGNQGANVFFLPFAFMKLLADISNEVSRFVGLDGSSQPYINLINRWKPGSDFANHINTAWEKEQALMAADEEVKA